MPKSRTATWIGLILVPVGLLLVAIPGMWLFMTATAPVLHPTPEEVPSVTVSPPAPSSAAAVEQARRIVRTRISEENLPGLSVAVGIGGDIVWAEGFGFADLRASVPVTPNHRFRIGTASTALTSAAAGLLLENGRLKLDDQIQTYVPAFPKKQWPVTLREVMGHTAGIISDDGDEGPLFRKQCERPVEALPHFAENPLLFKPGTEYRYSDYGWIVVSAAVEAAANQPFLTYMRERIFEPLGMRDTVPDPGPDPKEVEGEDFPPFIMFRELMGTSRGTAADATKKPAAVHVTPYFPRFSADPKYGLHLMRPTLDFSCYAGSSVFLSTPSDLVRFGMAINSGKLLQPATVQLLQTPQRLASGKDTGYGLGWDTETVTLAGEQTRVAGHDGELLGGMTASLMTFPEHGMVVSVISNISYADTFSLAVKIAEPFAKQGKSPASK
jgi:serine beta-lactamase-like protein LACTB, mitochondrial